MSILSTYELWCKKMAAEPLLLQELHAISGNQAEISDRFSRDLEFGTGGLRGIMGVGTNRMNIYTVRRATQGLAFYLCKNFDRPSTYIAYDVRNMSKEFAEEAAAVLCANGIQVFLFDSVRPTPMLSFSVRYHAASSGIVITASHNPRQYNGYKVYGADGGQITDTVAAEILGYIDSCDIFKDVQTMPLDNALSAGLLHWVGDDVDTPYFEQVKGLAMRRELLCEKAASLSILYTPLHGTGNLPVRRALQELGFTQISIVPAQELPDGDFPTVPFPNPEDPSVFELAIALAQKNNPDLIFATDPDCDRLGVLVKDHVGAFTALTGNQIGALLCDYIVKTKRETGTLLSNAAIVKTIVTTDLVKEICRQNSVALIETLTGFKYIGEKINEWQKTGEYSFLFGLEESCGYLAGDFVRDKDAVIVSVLIAEMALYYKEKGLTLFQVMEKLYEIYGCFAEKTISITMTGQDGRTHIASIIEDFRKNISAKFTDEDIAVFEDYRTLQRTIYSTGASQKINLPSSNVLKFIFTDESWLVLRTSGTEPKIKIYIGVKERSVNEAQRRLATLEELVGQIVNVNL